MIDRGLVLSRETNPCKLQNQEGSVTRVSLLQIISRLTGVIAQEFFDMTYESLNLSVSAFEPVGGPYPVNLPTEVL